MHDDIQSTLLAIKKSIVNEINYIKDQWAASVFVAENDFQTRNLDSKARGMIEAHTFALDLIDEKLKRWNPDKEHD